MSGDCNKDNLFEKMSRSWSVPVAAVHLDVAIEISEGVRSLGSLITLRSESECRREL